MAADQSFGIKTADDFVDNLVRPDLDAFKKGSLDPAAAVRVAISLTHLMDWVFQERQSLDLSKVIGDATFSEWRDFQNFLEGKTIEMRWLREVANGSKHCKITRGNPAVTDSGVAEWGQLAWGEFPSDRPVFAIKLRQGEFKNFEMVVEAVVAFWRQLFSQL